MLYSDKKLKIFNEGFKLFKLKGTEATSIQEIVDKAGVAKGTFYLYFKDKYDLKNQLITKKSNELFEHALIELDKSKIDKFDDKIIFIIDYIINQLNKNKRLLKFIEKDLSRGLYTEEIDNNYLKIKDMFLNGVKENNIKLKNPELTLYMIIELVGSTCPSLIINNYPTTIEEFKPYLYDTIKKMMN